MAKQEHLNNAPITEAILDIWTTGVDPGAVEDLANTKVPEGFGPAAPRFHVTGIFGTRGGQDTHSSASAVKVGFIWRSADKLDAVQARIDGFTVNRLSPYKDWHDLKQLAQTEWPCYVEAAQPERISRLGVRYVNQFAIPVARPIRLTDIQKYLDWTPSELESSPDLEDFMVRMAIKPDPSTPGSVTLLTTQSPDGNSGLQMILDIEFRRDVVLTIDSSEMWTHLTDLRDLKNRVFFASITNDLKEMFK